MATSETEIRSYPFGPADGLTIDPIFRQLQERGPIKVQLPFGEPSWLATGYEDCRTVYSDRRFGRQLGLTHDAPGMWSSEHMKDGEALFNMDPPEHTRVRRLTSGAFSPARVAQMHERIQGKVDRLFDDMAAAGPGTDFMAVFAEKLSPRVMGGLLGVAEQDLPRIIDWIDDLVGVGLDPDTRRKAHGELEGYILGLIAQRRANPTDDILGNLVAARDEGDRLSEKELFNTALALWLGGVDTTHYSLGNIVFTLMTHRDHWQELLDDPDLLPNALEELWRFIPSHKYGVFFPRWSAEDVELSDGIVIPAGEPVIPEHPVANRDESAFPNGWELDFHRVDPQPHLTFAHGPHHCMGAHLARLEVRLAMEGLLQRFPTLQLAVPADEVHFSPTSMMRGIEALPLTW